MTSPKVSSVAYLIATDLTLMYECHESYCELSISSHTSTSIEAQDYVGALYVVNLLSTPLNQQDQQSGSSRFSLHSLAIYSSPLIA